MMYKLLLRMFGGLGAALFLFVFASTYNVPEWVEDYASTYIQKEAAKKIDEKIDSFQAPSAEGVLTKVAAKLYKKNEAKIVVAKEKLRTNLHVKMADAIAAARDLDCDCRNKYVDFFKKGMQFDIQLLQKGNDKLVEFIQFKYLSVVDALRLDVRIFSLSNAFMFVLILLAAFLKPNAQKALFVPAILLLVATLVCAYGYVFEQNWLLTIINSDYLGFAYLAYLGLVFAFLCDIVLNAGRVTWRLLSSISIEPDGVC